MTQELPEQRFIRVLRENIGKEGFKWFDYEEALKEMIQHERIQPGELTQLLSEAAHTLLAIFRSAQQRAQWPRDSNEDNHGWINLANVAGAALKKVDSYLLTQKNPLEKLENKNAT